MHKIKAKNFFFKFLKGLTISKIKRKETDVSQGKTWSGNLEKFYWSCVADKLTVNMKSLRSNGKIQVFHGPTERLPIGVRRTTSILHRSYIIFVPIVSTVSIL